MFALALWDRRENRFYWLVIVTELNRSTIFMVIKFSFGSEQKAIFAEPSFDRKINKQALLEYFTFQNIFTDQTLTRGISILPAGHYAKLDLFEKIHLFESLLTDLKFSEPENPASKEEYLEELDRLFKQAVKRQLVSDVELGAYLSGGMDSGSITAIASQSFEYLKSFTCGFDLSSASGLEACFDERVTAEALSYAFKTEHYEVVLKAGDMERCLPSLAWHLEEPRVGQSYPNFYAAKLASKFVKVVLSGVGGDELFAGYPWRYFRAMVNDDFEDYIDKYYLYWQRLVSNSDLKNLFSPISKDVDGVWTRDIFRDVFLTHDQSLDTPRRLYQSLLVFRDKDLFAWTTCGRGQTEHGSRIRKSSPFLDNDLTEFAMQCPVSLKLKNFSEIVRINENTVGDKQTQYFQQTQDGKQILREVMNRIIPREVTDAKKQGFSGPDSSWFKGDSIEFVKRQILDKDAVIYSLMDRQTVSELVEEHLSGKPIVDF